MHYVNAEIVFYVDFLQSFIELDVLDAAQKFDCLQRQLLSALAA